MTEKIDFLTQKEHTLTENWCLVTKNLGRPKSNVGEIEQVSIEVGKLKRTKMQENTILKSWKY